MNRSVGAFHQTNSALDCLCLCHSHQIEDVTNGTPNTRNRILKPQRPIVQL